MATAQTMNIVNRSATTATMPVKSNPDIAVAKLIDESKCIGCKACQVACMQWNDNRDEIGSTVGVYDNPADLTTKSWTVMRFNEVERADGGLDWLIRKDGCMHCEDPGCLKACPAPGAIVKYENGIVDFVKDNCIGCGYCVAGCPFNVPRISKDDHKAYKCTLCSDRVAQGEGAACAKACPTTCTKYWRKVTFVSIKCTIFCSQTYIRSTKVFFYNKFFCKNTITFIHHLSYAICQWIISPISLNTLPYF